MLKYGSGIDAAWPVAGRMRRRIVVVDILAHFRNRRVNPDSFDRDISIAIIPMAGISEPNRQAIALIQKFDQILIIAYGVNISIGLREGFWYGNRDDFAALNFSTFNHATLFSDDGFALPFSDDQGIVDDAAAGLAVLGRVAD